MLAAARRLGTDLAHWFPGYLWRIEPSVRHDIGQYRREESSELLRRAAETRDSARHDFVILVTPDELVARYRPFALAALSRPLDAAVLSTARLVPDIDGHVSLPTDRAETPPAASADGAGGTVSDDMIVDRLATLMMHALAHLAGERPTPEPERLLHRPDRPTDLDRMRHFDARELDALDAAFGKVADTRLEESSASAGGRWRFVLRAAMINREEITEAVRAARPWEFPQRLSRLTTAAVSTLALLLMTAESWDLGLAQGWTAVLVLALLVLALTTSFVVYRQQLLIERHRRLSEQLVATRITAVLIVVGGLATTWLGVLVLALLAALTLFDAPLIVGWAASQALAETDVGFAERARMATFCASIGLLIGSLGASFEEQHHFRHVIFVDEEL